MLSPGSTSATLGVADAVGDGGAEADGDELAVGVGSVVAVSAGSVPSALAAALGTVVEPDNTVPRVAVDPAAEDAGDPARGDVGATLPPPSGPLQPATAASARRIASVIEMTVRACLIEAMLHDSTGRKPRQLDIVRRQPVPLSDRHRPSCVSRLESTRLRTRLATCIRRTADRDAYRDERGYNRPVLHRSSGQPSR